MTLVPPTSIPQECEKLFWGSVGFREIYVFGFPFRVFGDFPPAKTPQKERARHYNLEKTLVCIAQFFVSRFTVFSGFP